jgi:GMP synthase (glutamine-hydrolysing)
MRPRPVLILRAGNAPDEVQKARGDFPEWIEQMAGDAWGGPWETHDVRTDEPLPSVERAAAWVITGSASSVTERAPWMLKTEEYIRTAVGAGVPVFGICFGHQMMAQAIGGRVEKNPRGRELGTVELETGLLAEADPVFRTLPRAFAVNASHVDTVVHLPEGARVLAKTALEPVAAFSVGESAWGVQFHPEFDGDVVRGYVRVRASQMEAEGLSPERAIETAKDTPHGRQILRNFLGLPVVTRRA